jgi:hypothetical protein
VRAHATASREGGAEPRPRGAMRRGWERGRKGNRRQRERAFPASRVSSESYACARARLTLEEKRASLLSPDTTRAAPPPGVREAVDAMNRGDAKECFGSQSRKGTKHPQQKHRHTSAPLLSHIQRRISSSRSTHAQRRSASHTHSVYFPSLSHTHLFSHISLARRPLSHLRRDFTLQQLCRMSRPMPGPTPTGPADAWQANMGGEASGRGAWRSAAAPPPIAAQVGPRGGPGGAGGYSDRKRESTEGERADGDCARVRAQGRPERGIRSGVVSLDFFVAGGDFAARDPAAARAKSCAPRRAVCLDGDADVSRSRAERPRAHRSDAIGVRRRAGEGPSACGPPPL